MLPPPFTGPELIPVANRLDRGLDCSRWESMRLLATLRLALGALLAERVGSPHSPAVLVDHDLLNFGCHPAVRQQDRGRMVPPSPSEPR
jgi:hypothetical protein